MANPRDDDKKESGTKDSNPRSDGPQLICIETDVDLDPETIGYIEDLLDIDPRRVKGRDYKVVGIKRSK